MCIEDSVGKDVGYMIKPLEIVPTLDDDLNLTAFSSAKRELFRIQVYMDKKST